MTDLLMPRRKFLTGLFGFVAAPAIVKAANIMPVKLVRFDNGVALTSMAHPIRKGGAVNLSELREMLRPSLEKMIDDMYTEHPGQWKSIFVERNDGND